MRAPDPVATHAADPACERERRVLRQLVDVQRAALARPEDGEAHAELAQRLERRLPPDACGHGVAAAVRTATAERRALQRERDALRERADVDGLTGLPDRRAARVELERRGEALAAGGRGFDLVLLGLDGFTELNRMRGPEVADDVLVAVAARLRRTVAGHGYLARMSGDEFALVASPGTGVELAERSRAAVAEPLAPHGAIELTASAGLVEVRLTGAPVDVLLREAAGALHQAKAAGRDRLARLDRAAEAAALRRQRTAARLQRAIRSEGLEVAYQPIVDIEGARVVGVEALARWEGEEGPVPPETFVPLAAELGLAEALDHLVLERAAHDVAALERAGAPALGLAVNVAGLVRADAPRRVGRILEACARAGLAPERLTLELTERALLADTASGHELVEAHHAAGGIVHIDDFGTGYSSLARLHALPIDGVKIPRSFMAGVDHDPGQQAVVAAVLALARELRLDVVAEGVEREGEWRTARDLGAHLVQGFRFARPMTADALGAWLRDFGAPAT